MRGIGTVVLSLGVAALLSCAGWFAGAGTTPAPAGGTPVFTLPGSLHGTAAGMRWWYERPNGLGALTGVSYADTNCGSCHASKCEDCHGPTGTAEPDQPTVCLGCHSRQNAEVTIGAADLHFAAGLDCGDCHSLADIHGDGTSYDSMLQQGALSVTCESCHVNGSAPAPPNDAYHTQHGDKLTCDACHVATTTTCYNCHFNSLLEDHVKKPYKPFQNFVILLNDKDGKVRVGTYQAVVKDGTTFVAFGPYHGHTVSAQGRLCADCHNSARMTELKDTGKIVMTTWNATIDPDTTKPIGIEHTTGVIPFVPDKLEFQFVDYDKATDTWSPLKTTADGLQWEYCSPLTDEQLQALGAQ
jgi:hypothetical protein